MKEANNVEFTIKLKAHQIGAVLNALDMVATPLESGGEKIDRRKILGLRNGPGTR